MKSLGGEYGPWRLSDFDRDKWILKYLLPRLAQLWGWWPPRRQALDAAQVSFGVWKCAECGRLCARQEREVDHIIPKGARPKTMTEFLPYVDRTLCNQENLRVLCKAVCHRAKTTAEAKVRAAKRRSK